MPLVKKQPAVYSIEIAQMKFTPSELNVKKGDIILFINHDLVPHDITEERSKSWSSSPLAPGQTWKLEVTEAVNYFCSIHPVMKGKIFISKDGLN
jgi:plastocyanin